MTDPLFFLVVIAVAIVLVILAIGLGGFAKGGEFSAKYSNKLMRYRIIAQAVAVALIALYVLLRSRG